MLRIEIWLIYFYSHKKMCNKLQCLHFSNHNNVIFFSVQETANLKRKGKWIAFCSMNTDRIIDKEKMRHHKLPTPTFTQAYNY
jgi:hypothetical protein